MQMLSWRNISLGIKLALTACLLFTLVFAGFTWTLTRAAGGQVTEEAFARMHGDDRAIASLISLYDKGLVAQVARFMSLFESFLPGPYALDVQHTVDIGGHAVPVFSAAGRTLDLDFTVPDDFLARSGTVSTVFARSGDDFIRISTSLKKQDGSRAIGTLLDRSLPAYRALMAGETFSGLTELFGHHFITEYKPVRDAAGSVIGALFVGVAVSAEVASVEDQIRQLKIGTSGYYFVLDASSGPNRGKLLVHPTAEGRMASDLGGPWARMLELKDGEIAYTSADESAGGSASKENVAVFLTAPEWHWIVGGVVPRDELTAGIQAIRDRFLLIGLVLVIAFGAVFHFIVRRLVSRPLSAAVKVSERLAAGDLSVHLATARTDEIGQLMRAIDGIGTGLATIVEQVRGASDDIGERTIQIAQANEDMASRIASEAASLEETSASVEELTSTVKHNAQSAEQANALVGSTAQAALDGGQAVQRVASTMDEISSSANKIADITRVIETIAFQINILALNAAVESARAGEHGRGFSVVAAEVRALAQRSAAAVKEVDALIAESVSKVQTGHSIAAQAHTAMQAIVGRVQQVRAVVAEIDIATREQAGGIEQVNRAVTHIGEVAQQNNALIADTERSMAGLRDQAERLAQAVSAFETEPADNQIRA
jgi:methyl-accepting chemotaxis protein